MRVEKSVLMVIVWHREALSNDAGQCFRGTDFLYTPNTHVRVFFLHTCLTPFYLEYVSFVHKHEKIRSGFKTRFGYLLL